MQKLKILNVVGARPQFVKMAVVSSAIRKQAQLEEVIVHSGQHSDAAMSQVFFDELSIPAPKYHLGISGTGTDSVVVEMESRFAEVIEKEQPDWVLVYGDTYTTRAAAQAAHHKRAKLAHVEAGLRSFNPEMPEELNRVIADRLSAALFAPTQRAVDQLWEEGLAQPQGRILLTGDVMKDAAAFFAPAPQAALQIPGVPDDPFLLCTVHRAEATDNPVKLMSIVSGLNRLAEKYPVVFPLHPRTAKRIQEFGLKLNFPALPPQGYRNMLGLIQRSQLVITDSGGLQKEAFFMRRFCVTLRNETEWRELTESGYNLLVGADEEKLIKGVEQMIQQKGTFDEPLYGDGKAAEKIAAFFVNQAEKLR